MVPSPPHSINASQRPKGRLFAACVVGTAMLGVSFYGFWQWFALPPDTCPTLGTLYLLMCTAIVPLALVVFIAVFTAQKLEHDKLSTSYQMRIDHLQKRLNTQEDLLHAVTDNNPEAIAIFDARNSYWFANAAAARVANADPAEIVGKTPSRYMSHDAAKKLEARLGEVRRTGETLKALDQVKDSNGRITFMQTHFEQLRASGDFPGGIMVRTEDVTTLVIERERRENMLSQVIATMVAVVDRRDPYASGHSARVGELSRAIAEEMVLGEKEIEAAEIAGSLMNFGKVLVPREILTKTTALTPDELQRVRDSILTSADILSIIDFTGPVVPTLKQVMERYDGSGAPRGLKGNDILITARIVTVANTYVALVSPRAHRPSLGFTEAVEALKRDGDKLYDRNVVNALANYIGTRATKLDWLGAAKPS